MPPMTSASKTSATSGSRRKKTKSPAQVKKFKFKYHILCRECQKRRISEEWVATLLCAGCKNYKQQSKTSFEAADVQG
ncbi:hypothetical protein R3P38DRAFT_3241844 [Favolaschia claudopus]|uniref:Uncharacterized protein n=1 Tax=Favolaschia claudopus TaxID=2862362 RepID=A0AAV9Z537_9AGAR